MRRRDFITAVSGAAAAWPIAARAAAASRTIVAVAIGEPGNSQVIRSTPAPAGIRPYIQGVIDGLSAKNFNIGDAKHYVIDYREFAQDQLNSPDNFKRSDTTLPKNYLILAMSTTVVWAAARYETDRPIVAIVSDYKGMGIKASNVCGISGQRSQFGKEYYRRFNATIKSPQLTKIYVLVKEGYPPALDTLRDIESINPSIDPTVVNVPTAGAIQETIGGLKEGSGGLLVLPADWFFALAQPTKIPLWARQKKLPDFWPVTDWLNNSKSSALAGYGVSQKKCGELLGGRIAEIWSNNDNIPSGNKFPAVKTQDCNWQASAAAAADLGITLGSDKDLEILT